MLHEAPEWPWLHTLKSRYLLFSKGSIISGLQTLIGKKNNPNARNSRKPSYFFVFSNNLFVSYCQLVFFCFLVCNLFTPLSPECFASWVIHFWTDKWSFFFIFSRFQNLASSSFSSSFVFYCSWQLSHCSAAYRFKRKKERKSLISPVTVRNPSSYQLHLPSPLILEIYLCTPCSL